MSAGVPRVLIADGHASMRSRLRAMLERHPERVRVVGEAGNLDEAVARSRTLRPDVVLMRLRFAAEERTGADVRREIRRQPEAPQVLVVTGDDTDAEILRAVEAGTTGLSAASARRRSRGTSSPRPALTEREVETLSAVATGMSNREVARSLHLSEATVKSRLVQVFHKLEVRSRRAAVAVAREQGLLPDQS